ncbi:hypothetical protein [Novosphingobium sp. TH158]|uniref:hypothetical protein n=1 Tax=Novosphingobium sp. TH158 TaxID=2067455 RepID=UPI000C7E467C|nr:hypothetical protein [Novosphingobium sp. TH158]PLK27929.1 hypothetical protein C0V78_10960 [Novosphingobium sp. TH158]
MDKSANIDAAVERAVELAAEVESAGEASTSGEGLAFIRAELHKWVDTVAGVVVNAGLGRVTLIHENGRESSVASSELPYKLSRPARFDGK